MSNVEGLGLRFDEAMSGYIGVGERDPRRGVERGRSADAQMRFDVQIRITDLDQFLRDSEHEAELTGTTTFTFAPLAGTFTIRDGRFNLFSLDPQTGMRQMIYAFSFTAEDGQPYYVYGNKDIHHDRGKPDLVEDITRLFTTIYRGEDKDAPVYGAGELYFKLEDVPELVASVEVQGATSWPQKLRAYAEFASFAYGALRDEYLKDFRFFYDTEYENLTLAGNVQKDDGSEAPFFFVSGVHGRGFPWGDKELFSDVLLAVADGKGGYQRYCITDRVLKNIELDIARGRYSYRGPLFAITEGYKASFSQMRTRDPELAQCQAEFEFDLEARSLDTVPFSIPLTGKLIRRMLSAMGKTLRDALPRERLLGIHITPHTVTVRSGSFRIHKTTTEHSEITEQWKVVGARTFGEAEHGRFLNVKEPTLLYRYLCALRPEQRQARVQILPGTLRDEREDWAKDRFDALVDALISQTASAEMLIENGKPEPTIKPLPPAGRPGERATPLEYLGDPIVEVNNDHFPTAWFQRRIVEVKDPSGERCLALEENMSTLRREAIDSDKKVTVASIKDDEDNKLRALDRVLAATEFYDLVEGKLAASGKDRAQFSIAIKPNFMFAYNKEDATTYTDPELVGHLVKGLRAHGFEKIYVVEAQSTYGEYFDKRSVREMAEYLGFDGSAGYEVIDMTEDAVEKQRLGPHLGLHPISRVWRDADFRVSFAKNKTHSYACYSLTVKNIYGALPLANKFKEYHCNRDRGIYHSAIEYLKAFPVDYGLIDAHLSADGPFGVFADPAPNRTYTIVGGADLVAVDWVGASKMGINPMISKYMKFAVNTFGKPEIELIGDESLYRPWLNVPVALAFFAHEGLDANYYFGNLFYAAGAQMDKKRFRYKSRAWHSRFLRLLAKPLRRTFFLRTGENPSLLNRMACWLFYQMGL